MPALQNGRQETGIARHMSLNGRKEAGMTGHIGLNGRKMAGRNGGKNHEPRRERVKRCYTV
jgi:hypothetical protein